MTGFFEGISNFFARRRAHCSVHDIYQSDCEACVAANQTVYINTGMDDTLDSGGGIFLATDSSSTYSPTTDGSSTDSSSTDSSSCDTSDFSGFDGGDSGGGGASGDF